jgi:membrane protease YdiL (CAAX protease family)
LYLIEKKNLNALGLLPNAVRMGQFALGLCMIGLIGLMLIGTDTLVQSIDWKYSGLRIRLILDAFVYHLRSALTEDLVFRGALLYILIRRLGPRWGILISALCFGVYHVFSYGILHERAILIAYVIVVTGFTGSVWAYAFHKTRSIYLGLGLHVGYNMVMSCFYESQPYGQLLFAELTSVELSDPMASYYSIFRGVFPSVMTLVFIEIMQRLERIDKTKMSEHNVT